MGTLEQICISISFLFILTRWELFFSFSFSFFPQITQITHPRHFSSSHYCLPCLLFLSSSAFFLMTADADDADDGACCDVFCFLFFFRRRWAARSATVVFMCTATCAGWASTQRATQHRTPHHSRSLTSTPPIPTWLRVGSDRFSLERFLNIYTLCFLLICHDFRFLYY